MFLPQFSCQSGCSRMPTCAACLPAESRSRKLEVVYDTITQSESYRPNLVISQVE